MSPHPYDSNDQNKSLILRKLGGNKEELRILKIRHRDYLSLHLSNNLKNSEILETTSRERGDYSFFKQVQDYSSPHLLTNAVTTLTNSKHKHLTGKSTSSRKYFWTTLIIMRRLEIHSNYFINLKTIVNRNHENST